MYACVWVYILLSPTNFFGATEDFQLNTGSRAITYDLEMC